MSVWEAYPADYRQPEVQAIQSAVRAGDCVAVVGLSGAGKSNLMGFLYQRCNTGPQRLFFLDGNRAPERTAGGLLALAAQVLGADAPALPALEQAAGARLNESPGGICLLIDRFDVLPEAAVEAIAGPLRALRDAYKYRLTYVVAGRRPMPLASELAELFYANTLWLGPLRPPDARWSAAQYAARRGQVWEAAVLERLLALSWGYPSLLRACCEAYAAGAALELEAMIHHPAVQRRVQEFWADQPSTEDVRRAGLQGQPLLGAAAAPVSAESPDLTASEHRLLAYLQAHPGAVCAKDDLIQAVWPEERLVEGLRDDSLAQLIRRLRQKIEADPANPRHIQTVTGRGYRYLP